MSIGNLHMLLGTAAKIGTPSGEIEFVSLNGFNNLSTSWTVPAGVFYISVAAIGGGGGGASRARTKAGITEDLAGGAGGGGGGLSFDNYLPVTPGETISVFVGAGGTGGDYDLANEGSTRGGNAGQSTTISRSGSWSVVAAAGGGGGATVWSDDQSKWYSGNPGSGGTGDGIGGLGGASAQNFFDGFGRFLAFGASGGGPGGWGEPGGNGRGLNRTSSSYEVLDATLGQSGGGAGGGNSGNSSIGAYGNFTSWPYLGTGGGILNSTSVPNAPGAGGPGAHSSGALAIDGGQGKAGRVRIMWDGTIGPRRSFPYGISPVISSASSVDEGSSITFSVTTSNVPNGTVLYWDTSRPEDFTTNSGSFVVNSNSGSFSVTPTLDGITEGPETFTVNVRFGSVSGKILAISNEVTINDVEPPAGDIDFTSSDGFVGLNTTWTVPDGIFSISVAVIGGGGGGASTTISGNGSPDPRPGGAGGGGGGLSFANDLPVTPGETITVILGQGGAAGTVESFTPLGSGGNAGGGNASRVIRSGSWEVIAGGGGGGASAFWNGSKYAAGLGGAGGTGDGVGGSGGSTAQADAGGFGRFLEGAGSGGGPGGWGGAGGRGYGISQTSASGEILAATLGELGGGAGGGNTGNIYAAYGNFTSWPYLGTGGGILNSTFVPDAPGAGGPGGFSASGLSGPGRQGKAGRVRIMWDGPSDPKRSFPYGIS